MDDTKLRPHLGYWVYAYEAGNLTLPNVGGSVTGATYNWSDLWFSNGTVELGISDIGIENWIETSFRYWDSSQQWGTISDIGDSQTISPWQGVFIRSYKDNIILIRRN